MNDTISRQDALNEVQRFLGYIDQDMIDRIKLAIGRLPSSDPKPDKNDMPEQGDPAKFGVITGETCTYWDRESNTCALHRPSAQPEQTDCYYCHEDNNGFVVPIEKNSHAVIHGSVLHLKAKGWRGKAQIKYCPICGRRLER